MKYYQMIHKSIFAISLILILSACSEDFLDRVPETEIGKENFFNSEEDLSLYINNLYNFPSQGIYLGDRATDNAATTGNTELKTIMTTNPDATTVNGGWDWSELRTINFFLENFGKAEISPEALNHFEGLARFFRARFYYDKVKRFSDVPWYDHTLTTEDEEELFKPRDPRDFVVSKIFEDLAFAAEHVRESSLTGEVNKWVVKAYQARFALHEGTFRKYHPELSMSGSANDYLALARDAALDIINSGKFAIYNTGDPGSDYAALFNSLDLSAISEVILVNIGINNLKNSGNTATVFGNYEVSPGRDLVQAYLMVDGSYYSAVDGMDTKLFVEEFENRDPRMYQTFAYPGWELYRTETYSQGGGIYIQQLQKNFSGYHQIKGFLNDPNLEAINNHDVAVLRYAETLLIFAEAKAELGELSQADLDMSINVLRARAGMPAMEMNPAVDPIQESRYPNISSNTQWKELLEIRRERRIELALEGFRADDVMRWASGKLLEKEPEGLFFPGLGKYDLTGDGVEDIILIDVSESIPAGEDKEVNSLGTQLIYYRAGPVDSDASIYLSEGNAGTIVTVRDRGEFVEPKYYYRPIPQTHVTINPNLTQIFGWE